MPVILIVAASPRDQDRLRLGAEVRDIRHALQRSRNRENWKIESNEAATVDDLRRALLDFRPTIVHFAGHGGGAEGLCFEDSDGYTHSTDSISLARLFHHFKDQLKCVVLNACYSDEQADVVCKEIDNVVGMRAAVRDDTARKFAVAFYDAVFAGTDFRMAFDLGCAAVDLNNLPQADVPVFKTSARLGGRSLSYSALVPEIERIVHAYLNTRMADRYVFTAGGIALLPLMKRHYGKAMLRPVENVQVVSMTQINESHWMALVKMDVDGKRGEHCYYLYIHDRTVLIEWEATVGLWSVPVKTYLALGTDQPVVARVFAELGDFYTGDFYQLRNRYQSVRLQAVDGTSLSGYIIRHTAAFNELMQVLEDGNTHAITLEIANHTDDTDTPVIQKMLSPTWLYKADGS